MPLPTIGSTVAWPAGITDQRGNQVRLSDFAGKHVLVYFYPKDDTPGCTIEACNFRDHGLKIDNTVILGASLDDAASHQAFISKFALPFPLLVDPKRELALTLGAISTPHDGYAARVSILFAPDGRVKQVWPKVDVATHWQHVRDAVAAQ